SSCTTKEISDRAKLFNKLPLTAVFLIWSLYSPVASKGISIVLPFLRSVISASTGSPLESVKYKSPFSIASGFSGEEKFAFHPWSAKAIEEALTVTLSIIKATANPIIATAAAAINHALLFFILTPPFHPPLSIRQKFGKKVTKFFI